MWVEQKDEQAVTCCRLRGMLAMLMASGRGRDLTDIPVADYSFSGMRTYIGNGRRVWSGVTTDRLRDSAYASTG
jgi:hypothetical protein